MSVIVMGMEMPSYCAECDAEKWDENEYGDEFNHRCGFMYKGYTHKVRDNGRLEECPLRPLPKKHGRVVDVGPLDVVVYNTKEHEEDDFDDGAVFILEKLDALPTIVEAEGE